jgi:hypothetical protein
MKSCFAPFRSFGDNLIKELELKSIFFLTTLSFKDEMGGSKVNFFVDYVHEMDLNENPILSLSPFGGWMTGLEDIYSMGS